MRRIHVSKRREREQKRLQRKKLKEREKKLERIYEYLLTFLFMVVMYLITEGNFINYYVRMIEFKENAVLVTAELVHEENYEKVPSGKYSRQMPTAKTDMTLCYELNGEQYLVTYENVYVHSSEANMDYYSHIEVYVLPDASDVQTAWVIRQCEMDARWNFVYFPIGFLVLWIVGIVVLEGTVFRTDKVLPK